MRLSALLVLLASSLFLACGGDDDQPSEPTEGPGGSQAVAASPSPEATPAATSGPQPTDTPVPPTPTETQPPAPTATATPAPPTPTQAPPTPTPKPGTIVIQLASSSSTPDFAVSGSAGCAPNAFPLAAGNATTLTCGNGNVTITITVPAPPGIQPGANPAACSVEDEGATPGASSNFNPPEIPDVLTVVLRGVLLDFEDVRCVVTLP
jgi:hypothetical protein